MNILLIDNYDSFTYNLLHLIEKACGTSSIINIVHNDKIKPEDAMRYSHIVISPGPGVPSTSANLNEVIERTYKGKPILGVCLGHQALAEVCGAELINMQNPCHGVKSLIEIDSKCPLFEGLPRRINVGRYHSWSVSLNGLPDELKVCGITADRYIMAIKHKKYNAFGLQFHPESYMTEYGTKIISNFLRLK